MVAYQISFLEVGVRVHLEQYTEFVAQLAERQNVDLMVAGSKPVKLPMKVGSSNWLGLQIFNLSTRVRASYRLQDASIAQRQCSSLVMSRSQVRILLEAPFGSLAQMDKSTTIRISLSGVRISHESRVYFWIWCLMVAYELWEFVE